MFLLFFRYKIKKFRVSCGLIVRIGGSAVFWNFWDRKLGLLVYEVVSSNWLE